MRHESFVRLHARPCCAQQLERLVQRIAAQCHEVQQHHRGAARYASPTVNQNAVTGAEAFFDELQRAQRVSADVVVRAVYRREHCVVDAGVSVTSAVVRPIVLEHFHDARYARPLDRVDVSRGQVSSDEYVVIDLVHRGQRAVREEASKNHVSYLVAAEYSAEDRELLRGFEQRVMRSSAAVQKKSASAAMIEDID